MLIPAPLVPALPLVTMVACESTNKFSVSALRLYSNPLFPDAGVIWPVSTSSFRVAVINGKSVAT